MEPIRKQFALAKKDIKYMTATSVSDNVNIAAVSKNGKVTAVKKGTCSIYVYAQNGVYKKIKVTHSVK